MESFLFSLEIVAPIFIMIVIGFIVRLAKILTGDSVKHVNKLIFYVLLPLLVFHNIYNTDIAVSFNSDLILFAVIAVLIQFFISLSIVLLSEKDNSRRGVMLQGMFRSNFVLYGIPLSTYIYGTEASARASLMIAVIIPVFNILATIALEMFNGGKPNFFKAFLGIIKNPLIIASALAVLLSVFNIRLPEIVNSTIGTLSAVTTPLAFIALGALINFKEIGRYIKPTLITASFKLLIFPAVFLGVAILFGFRDANLAILLALIASPVAVSSTAMAQEMGGDEQLAGQLVFFTAVLSVATIFLFIFLFRYFGYFA